MHSAALGRSRAERVAQVVASDPSVRDYAGYVPADGWALGTRERDALGKVRESAWEAAIDGRGEVGERCADDACQDPRCAHPACWIEGTPPPASPAAGAAGCLAETPAFSGSSCRCR